MIYNSKRYLLLGVLGTLTSTLTTAKTFSDGLKSLSEKDSPFGNAAKAANMGDFYKFEKYVYGDGRDMMDTSHVYGYAVNKMGISPYVAGLGWPHYYEAMRSAVVNAKKKAEYIDSLNTVNDDNSDGASFLNFPKGFMAGFSGQSTPDNLIEGDAYFALGWFFGVALMPSANSKSK